MVYGQHLDINAETKINEQSIENIHTKNWQAYRVFCDVGQIGNDNFEEKDFIKSFGNKLV